MEACAVQYKYDFFSSTLFHWSHCLLAERVFYFFWCHIHQIKKLRSTTIYLMWTETAWVFYTFSCVSNVCAMCYVGVWIVNCECVWNQVEISRMKVASGRMNLYRFTSTDTLKNVFTLWTVHHYFRAFSFYQCQYIHVSINRFKRNQKQNKPKAESQTVMCTLYIYIVYDCGIEFTDAVYWITNSK